MTMLRKIGRLFVIKTRLEAYLVTYAIAVGSIERGMHYMQTYPGHAGIMLAFACLGVPFLAGAKLLDSVRPVPATSHPRFGDQRVAPRRLSRSQPRGYRRIHGSGSPRSRHID
jgi:hypothetical protein